MLNFENYVPVKVVFGTKKLETIGEHVKEFGKKALIVTTGPFFQENGLVARIQKYLLDEGVESEYFSHVSPNPHIEEAIAGAELANKTGCEVIIGLGGGSAIDAAKCIAVASVQEGEIWPYWMGEKPIYDALPIVAVTTTSGTGSHITHYSVITNSKTDEKPGAGSPFLFPKIAIIDPELMISLPARMTAATGFDVVEHAIEAYTSNDANPISDMFCEKSLKIASRFLRRVVKDGSDVEAREMMALADTFSGFAISIAVITLCHAMGHAVGGVSGTVHGETLAAMAPSAIRHSMGRRPEKYINIGAWLSGYEAAPDDWTLDDTINTVEQLIKDIGMNIPLSEQGVKRSDFDAIIKGTIGYMGGGCDLDPAAPITDDVVRKVLEESF